jgi:hypothetical protein
MTRAFRHFEPGVRVRLSGKFLRDTGQAVGGEGSKVWTVLEVKQWSSGSVFVTVDEPRQSLEDFTAAELAADPMLKWRKINAANCTIVGQLDSRDVP